MASSVAGLGIINANRRIVSALTHESEAIGANVKGGDEVQGFGGGKEEAETVPVAMVERTAERAAAAAATAAVAAATAQFGGLGAQLSALQAARLAADIASEE